jgi:ATP-binding cassette subfamily C protein
MTEAARKVAALIGPGQRKRWLAVAAMAAIVSVAEAGSTLLVFTLLGLLAGEATGLEVPVVGDVRGVLPWDGMDLLAAVGVVTAVVFVARSVLILVQQYVQFRVAEIAGARLSTRLLEGYLAMPYAFHLRRNSSELVRNAFDSVRRFVDEGLVPAVRAVGKSAIVLGVLVVLVVSSPLATLFAVAVLGPLLWLVLRVVFPRVKRLGRTAQTMAQQNLQSLQQSLHGIRDITVLGRQAAFADAYRRDRRAFARARYLQKTAAQVPRTAIETGLAVFIVGFVWVAAATRGGAAEALPLLGLFGYAAARLLPELQAITRSLNQMKFVGPAVDDIHADLQLFEAGTGADRLAVEPLAFRDALALHGVGFAYEGTETPAVADVTAEVHSGESVGIVGPTGSGKSTLVDVLLGLLSPTEGRVTVDGLDLHVHARAWQANLGVVPQMVFLIDDTLRANIALGVPQEDIDEDSVAEAVAMAQLDDFVASLPAGLDTQVGERGIRVSGGQRQRLAIARALYRRPSVLIFDEGTSALDTETETALLGALENLRGDRTLITVAHRLTTVESCDTVWLIRGGRLVDQGPFAELARRNPELGATAGASETG